MKVGRWTGDICNCRSGDRTRFSQRRPFGWVAGRRCCNCTFTSHASKYQQVFVGALSSKNPYVPTAALAQLTGFHFRPYLARACALRSSAIAAIDQLVEIYSKTCSIPLALDLSLSLSLVDVSFALRPQRQISS